MVLGSKARLTSLLHPQADGNSGVANYESPAAQDQSQRARRDDNAITVRRPAMYRAVRHEVPLLPRRTPNTSAQSDRHAAEAARSNACNHVARVEPATSFPFRLAHRLVGLRLTSPLNRQLQSSRNFRHDPVEGQLQNRLARMEYDIHRRFHRRPGNPHGLPHSALDTVAFDRSAQHFAHRESYTQRVACNRAFSYCRTPQEKHRHVARELPTARPVNPLKVRMPQQVPRLRKLIAGGSHNLHTRRSRHF